MNSAERSQFETQLGMLCAGFNVPMRPETIEAYWTGLAQMSLIAFTRVVEHAIGPNGPEKFPKTRDLWQLYQGMKRRAAPPPRQETPREFDHFHGFAQRALMVFLRERGGASVDSLERLIAEKNRLVGDFRLIASEDVVTADEFREALFAAFRRVFQEPDAEQVELWRDQTCRERGLRFEPRRAS